ncbi:MAG TPA: selenocysteine-specific translation elongation factor [Aggregatilineales bacterium]|nr:selenocysteine-specific translation elongation factor [Aggregatilineales bacterium]
MRVIGTAGHVDHGKSTLVHALTGINPDRLKEEQARQMTIDLGFAWMTLPVGDSAETIGIIDVPGHRDFIENMLAGVGGIDAVLFVVAADEGVMPQTREHLAIIDLLGIRNGVVALTKIDLVEDPGWLELVQFDLEDKLAGTVLANAPIIPVSARTGVGLDRLQSALVALLDSLPPPRDLGKPHLWVDRVFTVSGFGTVVTGTLLDGELKVGDTVEFQPGGLTGRIRGLQSHNQALQVAQPGGRVAANIAGIEKSEVRRGMLLTLPGAVRTHSLVEVRYQALPDSQGLLKHNGEVKFFCGSAETMARVRLLDSDLRWIQLVLRDPLPLSKGDRFILRCPSPAATIGGGTIVNPASRIRWKRGQPDVLARLEILAHGSPTDMIGAALDYFGGPVTAAQITEWSGLDDDAVLAGLPEVAIALKDEHWISVDGLDALLNRLSDAVARYHHAEPLRAGIRPQKLCSDLKLKTDAFESVIEIAVERGRVTLARTGAIAAPDHSIVFGRAQQTTVDTLMESFAASPYSPPSTREAEAIVGSAVLEGLIERGDLIQLTPEVLLTPSAYVGMVAEVQRSLDAGAPVTIKLLRDRFATSRKYAQAVLEYLDNAGVTRRAGDDHVLASGDWSCVL